MIPKPHSALHSVSIEPRRPGDPERCEALLRALPEWFGIEDAIVQYRKDVETYPTLVARREEAVVGFLTYKLHFPRAAEIVVLAVAKPLHRGGLGRRLVERSEEILRKEDVAYYQVKTLGPSRPNEEYARTREFYTALGFCPLEEHTLWGPVNPCLVLVKHLGPPPPETS